MPFVALSRLVRVVVGVEASPDEPLNLLIPAVSALVGAAIGAGALLLAQYLQWKRENSQRVNLRSEEAAALMLPIIDSLRVEFRSTWGQADGPPQGDLYDRYIELSRLSIDVIPDEARAKLVTAAECFYYYDMASPYGPDDGYLPSQIGHKVANESHAVIGAIRRHELKIPATPQIDDIKERIEHFAAELFGEDND